MSSIIVNDNDLKENVSEYGSFIDTVLEKKYCEPFLTCFEADSNEIANMPELIKLIYESSGAQNMTKLSEREFEPTFYLLINILEQLEGSVEKVLHPDSVVLKCLIECVPVEERLQFRDRKSIRTASIVSILSSSFNLLPSSSANRIHLIGVILDIISKSNLGYGLIQHSIGDHIVQWMRDAKASDEEIRKTFWSFVGLDNERTFDTLQLMKHFTTTFRPSLNELRFLIEFALISDVVDVSFIVNNSISLSLKEHANDDLVDVFSKYVKGELISEVPEILQSFKESIVYKSKILCLARFFVEHNDKKVFKYDEVPSYLVSDHDELELLLIDAVKAHVIEAKLSQVDQTFYLSRVNRFITADDEKGISDNWNEIRQVLQNWQFSLDNIDQIVKASKEDIVNNNSF